MKELLIKAVMGLGICVFIILPAASVKAEDTNGQLCKMGSHATPPWIRASHSKAKTRARLNLLDECFRRNGSIIGTISYTNVANFFAYKQYRACGDCVPFGSDVEGLDELLGLEELLRAVD